MYKLLYPLFYSQQEYCIYLTLLGAERSVVIRAARDKSHVCMIDVLFLDKASDNVKRFPICHDNTSPYR